MVVCVKWGDLYSADYVNRLFAGTRRHLSDSMVPFVCFTEDGSGLDAGVEVRHLPARWTRWWGKAYLFSEEAGLDGHRVLFLDLDQVIVGSLDGLAHYSGPFCVLSTAGIACELARGGYNSSVMAWEASPFFRGVFVNLTPAVLKYVVRFDHWLEMNVVGADLWQRLLPGAVIDYTTTFRAGVCLGSAEDELEFANSRAFASEDGDVKGDQGQSSEDWLPPPSAAIVTFPRNPKPHEVLDKHAWLQEHWIGRTS